jgi:pyruvate/2-oxoglutarate/acetoin dehydrogenase E1 component
MRNMGFGEAIDDALAAAMAADHRILLIGEDVRMMHHSLFLRFGAERVRETPISESAFLGAGVAASMAGLRPVVEIMMADFLAVAMDPLLNHAAKLETFSGGTWRAPVVVRVPCGGGYGDGGQHEQSLWGWLAHIPGLAVAVPSTPADAGALMLSALGHDGPVVFMEHKLLSATWREALGTGGRKSVRLDVPVEGSHGPVPRVWEPLPFGQAAVRREGADVTMVSLGVGVHRALQAAQEVARQGLQAEVIDLRTVAPLDGELLLRSVRKTGRVIVVDEDYRGFGLSGELAALMLEAGLTPKYARVCTEGTIPYARRLEDEALPNGKRITETALRLTEE